MPEIAPTLAVTLYCGLSDAAGRPHEASWPELRETLTRHEERAGKDGPLLGPYRLKAGARRTNAGVEALTVAVLDVDNAGEPEYGWLAPEEAARFLGERGLAFALATTHGHERPKDGEAPRPRFRVALPLATPVPASDWQKVWPKIAAFLEGRADASCRDVSRMYLLPSCEPGAPRLSLSGEGAALDVSTLPDPIDAEPPEDDPGARAPEPNDAPKSPPPLADLVRADLEANGGELFHCGGDAYALFPSRDGWACSRLEARAFRLYGGWVSRESGRAGVGEAAWKTCVSALESDAQYAGPERAVSPRWAFTDDPPTVWHALGDGTGRVIRTDAAGTSLVDALACPVRFVMPKTALALSLPSRTLTEADAFRALARIVNLAERDLTVAWGWLIGCFLPVGTLAALSLEGEQGCGKSVATRFLRGLVDPVAGDSRSLPRDGRWGAALGNAVLAFANLSNLSPDVSDDLCKILSGEGFSDRALYTDGEEVVWTARRPVVFSSIAEVVSRADLMDRTLPAHLGVPRVRRPEDELNAEYAALRPELLGLLHLRISRALAGWRSLSLDVGDARLADLVRWITASEPPEERGSFHRRYLELRRDAEEQSLESSPFVDALAEVVADAGGAVCLGSGPLLKKLRGTEMGTPTIRSPRGVTAELKRLSPSLRRAGWTLHQANGGTRAWTIAAPTGKDAPA